MAESAGIVPATLVLYENDKHPIKYKTAVVLADELNIDLQRLLDSYTTFVDYPCGDFLKEIRKSLKLSQAVIAQDIGICELWRHLGPQQFTVYERLVIQFVQLHHCPRYGNL